MLYGFITTYIQHISKKGIQGLGYEIKYIWSFISLSINVYVFTLFILPIDKKNDPSKK
jgi:hypothetical protein